MLEVDLCVGPGLEAERRGALVRTEAKEGVGRNDISTQRSAARDSFQLAQLLERVDSDVRVRADAHPDAALAELLDREEAVAQVGFGGRARADARIGLAHEVELRVVGVRRMDDRRSRAKTTCLREELDRADPVLLDAFLDFARLLVRVDVKRELVVLCVAADLFEPARWAGTHGVGGEADLNPALAQVLDLVQILGRRGLPEAGEAASGIGDVEEDERDARGFGGLGRSESLFEAEIVELTDRGVAGSAHLAIDAFVASA